MRQVFGKAISVFLATVLCAGSTIVPVAATEAESNFAAAEEEVILAGEELASEDNFEISLEEEAFDIEEEDATDDTTEEATEGVTDDTTEEATDDTTENATVEASEESIEAETEPQSAPEPEETLAEEPDPTPEIPTAATAPEPTTLDTEETIEIADIIIEDVEEPETETELNPESDHEKEAELAPDTDPEEEAVEVASIDLAAAANTPTYSYQVIPLLAPFNCMVYVETDDPTDFRLADYDTVYDNDSDTPPFFVKSSIKYDDVVYEDEDTQRVHGGYIFSLSSGNSDGGTLTLQRGQYVTVTSEDGYSYRTWDYVATDVKVECPALVSPAQYLVDTYTNASMGFFEKMSAAETGLYELSWYPMAVKDGSKPNEFKPYPYVWLVDYYRDQNWLEDRYASMFANSEGLLLSSMYPFVVDSLGFPYLMREVALYLDPECDVKASSSSHAYIEVTKDGEKKAYGGQGNGDMVMFIPTEKLFTFTGDAGDRAFRMTVEECKEKHGEYRQIGSTQEQKYRDLMGDFWKDGKGEWLRISRSGTSLSIYVYLADLADVEDGSRVCNAWVDGRYVDNHGVCLADSETPPTFEDHPTADILLHDQNYTNRKGKKLHGDVLYTYFESIDAWAAPAAYYEYINSNTYADEDELKKLPAAFILTKDQVNAAKALVAANHAQVPASGLIYDGTELPGTPFENVSLKSISFEKDKIVTTAIYQELKLPLRLDPASAFEQNFNVVVDESNLCVTTSRSYGVPIVNVTVFSYTELGSYDLKVTTADGKHSATCKIVVEAPMQRATLSDFSFPYTGKPIKPTVTVEDSAGKILKENKDYTVEYIDNVKVGTATVQITGMGIYQGSQFTKTFRILLPFTDVSVWDEYYDEIEDVYKRGLMTGMDAQTFAPDKELNRAFMAAVMYRRAGYPEQPFTNVFPDVKKDDWFAASALWARATNNIYGYENGKFGPTDTLTREQLCTILWRYAETTDGYDNSARADISKYPDVTRVTDFAKDAISWCVAEGIFEPRGERIAAWEPATRAELAVMLSRYLKVVGK